MTPRPHDNPDRQRLDRELADSVDRLLARLVGRSDLSDVIDVRLALPACDEFYAWSSRHDAPPCPSGCGGTAAAE